MATQYLNPLGFIDKLTETGATLILTNPKDSEGLAPGTPLPYGDTPGDCYSSFQRHWTKSKAR